MCSLLNESPMENGLQLLHRESRESFVKNSLLTQIDCRNEPIRFTSITYSKSTFTPVWWVMWLMSSCIILLMLSHQCAPDNYVADAISTQDMTQSKYRIISSHDASLSTMAMRFISLASIISIYNRSCYLLLRMTNWSQGKAASQQGNRVLH